MADEARLNELLRDWRNQLAAGRDVPAAELCDACPELSDELGRRIAAARHGGASAPAPETITFAPSGDSCSADDTGSEARPREFDAIAWLRAAAPPQGPDELARLGQFAVRRLIGHGGMGAVVLADDLRLHRAVAIKLMRSHLCLDPKARERFLREARAAARLDHERIVPIHHVDEAGGVPYLVMPLLAGESLQARLTRERVPPAEVLRIGREIAEGLAAAHAAGVIHRDVKPANVWLKAPHGSAMLLDFGLARVAETAQGLSQSNALVGTPAYVAPEQLGGATADHRADLFSLGVVLYELTTGVKPFAGPSMLSVLNQVATHHPPPPRDIAPDVPTALSGLIVRLLAKDPADRPTSAAAVVDALRSLEGSPTAVTLPPSRPRPPRRRAVWVACASAVGLAGLLALWPTAAPPPPVRVVGLDVRHYADVMGKGADRGLIGQDTFGTTVGDQLTVEARLSRPGYAYLVAFKTDGALELCFPLDETRPPPLTDRPRYPPPDRRDERFELSEGPGLQAFAVLASPKPLPAWRTWKASAGSVPWARVPADDGGTVWQDDGQWVTAATPRGPVRGDRGVGAKAKDGSRPVVAVTDWLRRSAGDGASAAAVAFGVAAKQP